MVLEQEHIFFLGIGGIGMSALARYLHMSGHKVSGYDRDRTKLTKKLEASGIQIQYSFDDTLSKDSVDMVIYTPAIKPDQPEFYYFSSREIEMKKRSEALKEILSKRKVIAVAGTHGKTSTSAILAHVLHYNSFGASAFVGGVLTNYETNFIFGETDWVVIEADEYDRSFWRIYADVAVIQAMDPDHLDIYGTGEEMIKAYEVFTLQMSEGGRLFVANEAFSKMSAAWLGELEKKQIEVSTFGTHAGDLTTISLDEDEGVSEFRITSDGPNYRLQLPGMHNVQNALAAIAIARHLGLSDDEIAKAIETFEGIERRFQYVLRSEETVIIDDYAHHPKEIDAAIAAAKAHHPERRLTVVFQPHLYSRTSDFMDEFAEALSKSDEVMLVELYPAREKPVEGINSHALLAKVEMPNKKFIPKAELITELVSPKRELILLLGAGDVYKLIEELKDAYIK